MLPRRLGKLSGPGDRGAIGGGIAAIVMMAVRQAAADALVKIGPSAAEPLAAALSDRDCRCAAGGRPVRLWAADRTLRAVAPLVAALRDHSANERLRQAGGRCTGEDWDSPCCGAVGGGTERRRPICAASRRLDALVKIGAARTVEAVGGGAARLRPRCAARWRPTRARDSSGMCQRGGAIGGGTRRSRMQMCG